MSDTIKLKIEEEFDTLLTKLDGAITNYDHRLREHIATAKANVLAHAGIAPTTGTTEAPQA